MKNFITFFCISFLLVITSCEEDDRSGSFVGVWIGNNITVSNCNRDEDNSSENIRCDDASCYRLELNGNQTFTFQEGLPTKTGEWSPSGGLRLCVEEDGEQVCETYMVALTSSTLAISQTNETIGCITTINFTREVETEDDTADQ